MPARVELWWFRRRTDAATVPEQILAVCDADGVEEFTVWATHEMARWPALWPKRLRGPELGCWCLPRPASADCGVDRDHEP